MRNFAKCLVGAGVAVLLAASALAQTFSYGTTVLPPGPGPQPINAPNNGGLIEFIDTPVQTANAGGIGTDIVLCNIRVDADPTVLTTCNIPFTTNLTITPTGGNAHTQAINWVLGGSNAPGQANNTRTYVSGLPWTFTDVPTGIDYVVTIGLFTPPQPFKDDPTQPGIQPDPTQTLGSLGAHVMAVPEPGSLALLGAGLLPMLGLIRRRKA